MNRDELLEIIETLPVGVFITDATGKPVLVNRRAAEILGEGVRQDASVGNIPQVYQAYVAGTDDLYPSEATAIARALRGEACTYDDVEIRSPGRAPIPVESWGAPFRDATGSIRFAVAAFVDISDRRRAESAERERERLAELDDLKTNFLTSISHEIRTPLTAITAIASMLVDDLGALDTSKLRDLYGKLARSATRLESLIVDLLDVERLLSGAVRPRLVTVNIGALVRAGVLERIDPEECALHLEVTDAYAVADPAHVMRIVEVLLSNAQKHAPSDSPIRVSVEPMSLGALLSVEDRGPGVPERDREAIFDPFWRGETSPDHAPGLAVGLTIVRRLAEAAGGRAWVDDRPDGGAAFKVFFPRTSPAHPAAHATSDQMQLRAREDSNLQPSDP